MNVPGIVLHRSAASQLSAFLHNPSHAVFLAGPHGCGKSHIAVSLAAQLLDVPEPEAHAYYRAVQPDGKGTITIEQIRTLIGFFQLKVPGSMRIKRVAAILDADSMGTEAQNALLKILEEPPEDSVLILTSSRPQSLLPTIRSRVQLLQLVSPTADTLTEHFAQQGFEASAIASALVRSGTDIAEAARILADGPDAANSTLDLVKKLLAAPATTVYCS